MTKILILGDSFSNPGACKCIPEQMWWHYLVEDIQGGLIVDLTKAGGSMEEINIKLCQQLATTHMDRVIIGLPPLDRRALLTIPWEDGNGRFSKSLTDYHQQFDHINANDVPDRIIHFLHPLLILAGSMSTIVSMLNLCKQKNIQCFIANMTWDFFSYNGIDPRNNTFTKDLFLELHQYKNFLPHDQSCKNLCEAQNIRPHDFNQYGWAGHHSAQGQRLFGEHVYNHCRQHNVFSN
jgi:hypothetical protein